MGVGLVGAMVEALRRHNRGWAERTGRTAPPLEAQPETAAWGYLTHPALMPTVFSPSGEDGAGDGEEVAERKV